MKNNRLHQKAWVAFSALTFFFWLDMPAYAQSNPTQKNQSAQDNDTTHEELAHFDQFLDKHREIAEQLRRDPSLVNNQEFVKNHPALQDYLQQHPAVREEIKENPNAFMRAENRFDRREEDVNRDRDLAGDRDRDRVGDRDTTHRELASFDHFLDSHRDISEQLRKDPSLVDNKEFVKNHLDLQSYLQDHPAVREEIKENPNAFMQAENRFDRREEDQDRDRDRAGDPGRDRDRTGDRDTTHQELANFDHFLDSHRDISQQLRKDPSLVDNKEFVKNHPDLQSYLQEHPAVREEIKENPNAFMQAENRFDRREEGVNRDRDRDPGRDRDRTGDGDTTYKELANFDRFLDSHRDISEQLRKDPSLVDNKEFVKNHPALQSYLQEHPAVREEIKENPNAFMQAENRLDRREEDVNRDRDHDLAGDRDRDRVGDRDTTHKELANFDRFLDSHREISEQLRKDPSLVDNKEFVKNHPALQSYLQEHPAVREEIKENPNSFMQAENRLDRREEDFNRDRHVEGGVDRDALHRNFGEFLGGHSDVAQQLSKNPSLVKNQEFMESHPELKEYLNAHPDVRQQLLANPQSFMKSAQQFSNNNVAKTPTTSPKPKQ